jgi:hypothetical protein
MNDQQMRNKIQHDAEKVKEDMSTLAGDTSVQIGRIEENINQATTKAGKDMTTWVEDGVSHFSDGFDKLSQDTRETVRDTTRMMKKDMGHNLREYNTQAQNLANKMPFNFSKKTARYPWVIVSIGLILGFILGNLLKPDRQMAG